MSFWLLRSLLTGFFAWWVRKLLPAVEGEIPGGVNLNLFGGSKSCIPRHSDNEPVLGGVGDSELIVSVSFGGRCHVQVGSELRSRTGSSGWSQRLSHCDVFVKDGKAQDQLEHWITAGVQEERINLTYRWIRRQQSRRCFRHSWGIVLLAVLCGRFVPFTEPLGALSDVFSLGFAWSLPFWLLPWSPSFLVGTNGTTAIRACKGVERIKPKVKFLKVFRKVVLRGDCRQMKHESFPPPPARSSPLVFLVSSNSLRHSRDSGNQI